MKTRAKHRKAHEPLTRFVKVEPRHVGGKLVFVMTGQSARTLRKRRNYEVLYGKRPPEKLAAQRRFA
jgi:hypothetical protein